MPDVTQEVRFMPIVPEPALISALKRSAAPVECARSLPPPCYHDPDVLAFERDAVFLSGWIGVGRSDRWREPGSYSAISVAGVPVIVLRGDDGVLRAFANSCQHRGMRLLEGEGRVAHIRCPFHAWTYSGRGDLLSAPGMRATPGFDPASCSLPEFRVAETAGFAFVCLDQNTPELSLWLTDFQGLHAQWSLADLRTARRTEFDVACNWKLFIEVFNEYYHLPSVHPDSISQKYRKPDPADPVGGMFTTQFGETQENPALLTGTLDRALPAIPTLEGRNAQGTRYTWIYPNTTFAASVDSLWMFEVFPLGADRCRVGMTVCFTPQAMALDDFDSRAQAYFDRFDLALAEDIPALEGQQAGLSSPFATQGPFAELEPSVANFARWYAERVLTHAGELPLPAGTVDDH